MLKVGSKNVTALKVGTKNVVKVYKGTTQVWPTNSLSLSASSLQFAAAGQSQNLTINVPSGQAWTLNIPVGSKFSANKTSGTGTTTISISVGNNTTESAQSSVITVSSAGLTATCNCSQAAGVQFTEYTNWVTNSVTVSANTTSIAAAGGSATLSAKASQSRSKITKWNGIETGRTTETQTPDVSTSATYSKVSGSGSVSGRTVTFPNNTSTNALSGVYRATYSGKTADVTITQAAGSKVYGNWTNTGLTIDTTTFSASGGSAQAYVNIKRTYTWNGVAGSGGEESTSGALNSPQASDSVVSFKAAVGGKTPVTVSSLGTTFKSATTITITAASAAATNRVSATVTQAANYVTAARALKTRTLTYPQIGAGGGTSNVQWDAYPTDADIDKLWGFTWVSGADGTWSQAKLGGSNAQTGMSYKWTGASGNFTALNTSTGAVTASSKGTTVNGVTSSPAITATQTCKFTNNAAYGGSSVSWDTTATGTCSQAANAVTNTTQSGGAYTYGNVTAGTITNAVVPAGGTATGQTYTATAGNGSQSWSRTAIIATDTYTSGSKAQRTVQAASSGTNAVAPSPASLNSGSVASKGQVQSGQTVVKSTTVTWAANGKSATGTMYVYQQENKFITQSSSCDGYRRYGVKTYTSGNYEYSEENSYYCGYRVTISLNVSVTQSGILASPVFDRLQAWSCQTGNIQGQGSSTVTFSNPKFGNNAATLSLSESEKNYGYVLFQAHITYTDSAGAGAIPAYSWSGAVTYSGSLAIYTKANAMNADVTVSAATRSTTSLQEDAIKMLEQIESGKLDVPEDIKNQLTQLANN